MWNSEEKFLQLLQYRGKLQTVQSYKEQLLRIVNANLYPIAVTIKLSTAAKALIEMNVYKPKLNEIFEEAHFENAFVDLIYELSLIKFYFTGSDITQHTDIIWLPHGLDETDMQSKSGNRMVKLEGSGSAVEYSIHFDKNVYTCLGQPYVCDSQISCDTPDELKTVLKDRIALSQVDIDDEYEKKPLLWIPGRNDFYSHSHTQLTDYCTYVLSYSNLGCSMPENEKKNSDWPSREGKLQGEDIYANQVKTVLYFLNGRYNKKITIYAHSTGCLILAYTLMLFDKDISKIIDKIILNSPFFEKPIDLPSVLWNHIAQSIVPRLTKNLELTQQALSSYKLKMWLQYRWDIEIRPVWEVENTSAFFAGAYRCYTALLKKKINSKYKILFMNSSNDDVLPFEEIEANCSTIFKNSSIVYKSYPFTRHDVLMPILNETMDEINKDIRDFL